MKSLNYILLQLLVFSAMGLCAQQQANIWFFGNEAGLNFNSVPPSILTNSKMNVFEGCASIADGNDGSLLFYTNGETVWDKNHNIMPNGTGLYGHTSSTQSALIIKQPSSANLFYIFTTDQGMAFNWGVNYSIVDLNANDGNGVVIEKNHFLFGQSTEQIAATACQNNKDFWIASTQRDTDTLFLFKLTEMGLSPTVIRQNTGNIPGFAGQMKFSSDGQLSFVDYKNNEVLLFDFDNVTGLISNKRKITNFNGHAMGLEFSPNSKFIYISEFSYLSKLYQCQVDKIGLFSIRDSVCTLISTDTLFFGQLQLAPNKKIYLSANTSSAFDGKAISVINSPDSLDKNCDFSFYTVGLNGKNPKYGLPSFPRSYLYNKPQEIVAENFCLGDSTSIYFNYSVSDSILLDFGDGIINNTQSTFIKHKYTNSGVFLIKVYCYRAGSIKDTLTYPLTIYSIKQPTLGNDVLLPIGDSVILNAYDQSIEKYSWNTGSTDSAYIAKQAGLYSVKVENKGCKAYDSVEIKTIDSRFSIQNTCFGDSTLFSLYSTKADSVKWSISDGTQYISTSNTIKHIFKDSGKYVVNCELFYDGLTHISSTTLKITTPHILNLGNDTLICQDKGLILNAYNPFYTDYTWNNGSKDSVINISSSGTYQLQAEEGGCFVKDSITIETLNCGFSAKGFCLGDSTRFSLNAPNIDSVMWNFDDGQYLASTLNIVEHSYSSSGNYSVNALIYISGLSSNISIPVTITSVPKPNLGSDTSFCINKSIKSYIDRTDVNFYWNDGSTTSETKATKDGLYILVIEKNGCTASDTINITIEDCDCNFLFPNSFTPNNDGLNDLFGVDSDCDVSNYHISIFNRWGELFFKSTDINNSWDGTYKNRSCDEGTYIWIASYRSKSTLRLHNQRGTVTLLR